MNGQKRKYKDDNNANDESCTDTVATQRYDKGHLEHHRKSCQRGANGSKYARSNGVIGETKEKEADGCCNQRHEVDYGNRLGNKWANWNMCI